MSTDIQALIDNRPHLKAPLEFYARWQRFCREVADLLPKERVVMSPDDSQAYPRDCARPVCDLFASVFDLPAEEMEPLRQAMAEGAVDFMRLPLDEGSDPDSARSGEELTPLLFLLSRPYFQHLRASFPLDGSQWEEGRCPLCSAKPALASIVEGPQRHLHCSFCGTVGQYRFIGCPGCGETDPEQLGTILSDDEPGFRVATCNTCKTYVKVVESSVLKKMTMDQADMASLPLDMIVQGKGFARMAPNPIGLKKME